MITLKTDEEIALMHQAGRYVEQALREGMEIIEESLRNGQNISKLDIDRFFQHFAESRGTKSAFKGFNNYPASVCISVNDEVVHGLPNEYLFKNGDVVTLDYGIIYKGWYGDSALTRIVGQYDKEDPHFKQIQKMINTCNESLSEAIKKCMLGNTLEDITRTIWSTGVSNGFNVINNFTGHGIGKEMHEEPSVFNTFPVPSNYKEIKLRKGMVFCLEPMLTLSQNTETVLAADHWTVSMASGAIAVHCEQTVAITDSEPLVLTNPGV